MPGARSSIGQVGGFPDCVNPSGRNPACENSAGLGPRRRTTH